MRHVLAALVAAIALLCAPGATHAGEQGAEASLQVGGSIEVDADGRTVGYVLEDAAALPAGIKNLIAEVVPGWRFEPVLVDGQPVAAEADMHLLFVARQRDDGGLAIALRTATFGTPGGDTIKAADNRPPHYPRELMREYVSGTVYALLRVDESGQVTDVFAEQTNLRKSGTKIDMSQWRRELERAALETLRQWRFMPADYEKDMASIRVPVDFLMHGSRGAQAHAAPGRWDAYLPGERHRAPWLTDAEFASSGVDALPAGTFQEVGAGLKLLTPLDAG